jgi:hypothetical protein
MFWFILYTRFIGYLMNLKSRRKYMLSRGNDDQNSYSQIFPYGRESQDICEEIYFLQPR